MSESEDEGARQARSVPSASEQLAQQLRVPLKREPLSESKAKRLEEQSWSILPNLFQDLVGYDRPALMELNHRKDFLLTETIREMTRKESAAARADHWSCTELGHDEGVRRVRERLEMERPQHVWLAPVCDCYSPSQRVNQKTPEQQQQLEARRQEALKQYVGVSCVVHLCMQQGTHVTVEMPAKNNAWRLPVFQKLKAKCQMWFATAQGCMVDRKDAKGVKTRNGWSVLTSHRRLHRTLDLPCKCPRQVVHGRAELGQDRDIYTEAFARKVCRAILQEGTHHEILAECSGSTGLLESFGEGEFCACSEVTVPFQKRVCAMCVPGSSCSLLGLTTEATGSQSTRNTESPSPETTEELRMEDSTESLSPCVDHEEEGMYTEQQVQGVEQQAEALDRNQDYRHSSCQQFLQQFPERRLSHHRNSIEKGVANIIVLGVYAHGNHYGITKWTRRLPRSCRYLMNYLKHWSSEPVHCSTIFVNKNSKHKTHRDNHNQAGSKNYVIGVTPYQQGELWLEGPGPGPSFRTVFKKTPLGEHVPGHLRNTRRQVVSFDAKKWHEPQGYRLAWGKMVARRIHKSRLSTPEQRR